MSRIENHAPYPRDLGLAVLFERQVAKTPHVCAVVCGPRTVTYAQLNDNANRLARLLMQRGISHGSRVALCLERSPELVLVILAILKAGAAYVPLDPAYPADRLTFMLDDSQAALLLTTRALAARAPGKHTPILCLEDAVESMSLQDAANPPSQADGGSTAYVMYTSGSTGTPKGVVIPQRGVSRLVLGTDYFPFGPDHTFALLAPVSFDLSTFELWGSLLHGARLAIFPERFSGLARLEVFLKQHQVNVLWLTAGLFNVVIDEMPQILAGVRYLLAGGEALSPSHVKRALQLLPDTVLINGYGPTECTTFACTHTIPRTLSPVAVSIPIGQPIANTCVEILDENRRRVLPGEVGELYLGGDGLATGYWNRPELTEAAFIPDPFSADPLARLYQTGDLVRLTEEGWLDYLGRIDGQVKIRGHRVEPGEIEDCLARHPAVKQVVVVPRQSRLAKQLVAFLVITPETDHRQLNWRQYLGEHMPAYMIPDIFVTVTELPLSPNGKVDRKLLAALDLGESSAVVPGREPTAAEVMVRMIWEEVLQIKNIRLDDNFFELGGDSLSAAAMMARLAARTGIDVPLAVLFKSPTIEGLAAVLSQAGALDDRTVVELQQGQGGPSLFFFHGDFTGGGFYCKRLAGLIGPELSFYAVQPNGLQGQPEPATLETMASRFLSLLPGMQQDAPLVLAGHCNGGMMAYEVARQLKAMGKDVRQVFLLDPPIMDYTSASDCSDADIRDLIQRRARGLPLAQLAPMARDSLLAEVYSRACESHGLKAYDGRVALLLARKVYTDVEAKALAARIKRFSGQLEWSIVPGDHHSMFIQEAPILAAVMRLYMQRAGILAA